MKKIFILLFLPLLWASCATTNSTALETMNNAIVGQNELVVIKRMGAPSNVTHTADGGKIMWYEHYSRGEFLTPNKSSITYNANTNRIGEMQGLTYTSNVNKATNDPKYTIYQTNVSCIKVHIDKKGNCVRLENTLPQEQLEVYHKRFKHFNSK